VLRSGIDIDGRNAGGVNVDIDLDEVDDIEIPLFREALILLLSSCIRVGYVLEDGEWNFWESSLPLILGFLGLEKFSGWYASGNGRVSTAWVTLLLFSIRSLEASDGICRRFLLCGTGLDPARYESLEEDRPDVLGREGALVGLEKYSKVFELGMGGAIGDEEIGEEGFDMARPLEEDGRDRKG
jgi:hypothetical protein